MSLPQWPPGTPGVLCVTGPHAIPVSTTVRAGDRRIVFALGSKRGTLDILREHPRAALCLLAESAAFTAYGTAKVIREELEAVPHVVAVELHVEDVQDHLADSRTEMLDGARWRWTDERAAEEDPKIAAELQTL